MKKKEYCVIIRNDRYNLPYFIEKTYKCNFKLFILQNFKCEIESQIHYRLGAEINEDTFCDVEKRVIKDVEYYKFIFYDQKELKKFNKFIDSLHIIAKLSNDNTFDTLLD